MYHSIKFKEDILHIFGFFTQLMFKCVGFSLTISIENGKRSYKVIIQDTFYMLVKSKTRALSRKDGAFRKILINVDLRFEIQYIIFCLKFLSQKFEPLCGNSNFLIS